MLLIIFAMLYVSYVIWLINIIKNGCKKKQKISNIYNLYVQDIKNNTNNNGNGMATELWRISLRAKYIKQKTYELNKLYPSLTKLELFNLSKICYETDNYTDKLLL